MPNIRIFGCSFTQGIENLDRYGSNWVHYFRDIVGNEYHIYNYSQAGSGVNFHSYLLSQYKAKYPNDVYICQLTTPGRWNWWSKNIITDKIESTDDINYHNPDFQNVIFSHVATEYHSNLTEFFRDVSRIKQFNYGAIFSNEQPKTVPLNDIAFAKEFYRRSDDIQEWATHVYYLISNSDFSYFHLDEDKETYKNRMGLKSVPMSIQTELGRNLFNDFIIDEGNHLNDLGNKKVAEFVYDNIKEKL